MNIQAYNKAIAAVLVPLLLQALSWFGITPLMPVGEALGLLISIAVTAIAVYAVPNKY